MKFLVFRFSSAFILLLILISLFSDFLSSNPPGMQNLEQFFQPPSRIRMHHHSAAARPFLYAMELEEPLDVRYQENTKTAYPLEFFYKGYQYRFLGLIPMDRHLIGRSSAPFFYPMGTDDYGRDVFSRVLAGARTSILVVILGLILYIIFGGTAGTIAGLSGGWIDSLLMRVSELVLALPALYIILSLRAILPSKIPYAQNLLLIIGIIAAVAWPPMARGIRGIVLRIRNSGYVEASRSFGASPAHIFRQHIFPALAPFIFAQIALAAPIFLLGEVVLSFLNIGFKDSGESWGSMLQNLKNTRVLTDFWWNLLPLGMVFLTMLCLNLLSRGLVVKGQERDEGVRL